MHDLCMHYVTISADLGGVNNVTPTIHCRRVDNGGGIAKISDDEQCRQHGATREPECATKYCSYSLFALKLHT